MEGYLVALALAALPATANFLGGLVAEFVDVSKRQLSLVLHLAAGIVFGVVAVELIPEALAVEPAWLPILAFVGGGIFFLGVDAVAERLARNASGSAGIIWFGVAIDLFSDGIMIGTGTSVEFGLGLLLALGQTPADFPEGFASIATFKQQGVERARRLAFAAAFVVPIALGVTVGYWGVRNASEAVQYSLLAFTAGILMTVVVEKIVPEAHQEEDRRSATILLVGGFALFALLAEYIG